MKDSLKKYLTPTLLLLTIAAIQFITMPRFFYPGDNFAIRTEAANLAYTGKLGIDYSQREMLGGFLSEKGQYFYENDAKQKFYSRYGIGNTLFYLPPYLVHKVVADSPNPVHGDQSLLFILNIYSILATVTAALFLYLTAALITDKQRVRLLFVFAIVYGSFFSHYFKHPVHENFQIALTAGFFYFALRFFMKPKEGKSVWLNIGLASCMAGILLTMKSSFIFFYVALGLALIIHFRNEENNLWAAIKKPFFKYILWLGMPAIVALVVLLASNAVRFNSPMESGYGQWIRNDQVHYFSLSLIQKTIPNFIWKKGNANIALHFPIIILAIPGFVALYRKKNPGAFWLLVISFFSYFLMISVYASWRGEWCYGPRHLIFILTGASIPAVYILDTANRLKRNQQIIIMSAMIGLFSYSARVNWNVNTIQCFAYHQVKSVFDQLKIEGVSEYFRKPITRSTIYRDIVLHTQGKQTFPPIHTISAFPNSQRACAQLDLTVKYFGQPNYYFAKDKNNPE